MKSAPVLAALAAMIAFAGASPADDPKSDDSALLFTSFRGNGEDGLHLATSKDGYSWTPINDDKPFLKSKIGDGLMRDPHLIQGPDATFQLVWTTGWSKHGLGYAHSKDLIHWSEPRLLDVMKTEPKARNVWAPEVFYDEAGARFVLFWSSTIPGRFPDTDAAGDDDYNHRIYATTTRDFETFTPTRLLYEPGFNTIDATMARDGDRYVLFIKDETRNPPAKNLRVAFGASPLGPFGPPSPPITGAYWAEGPTAIQFGGVWHVYFDRYTEHRYGLVTSTDLTQWKDESDRVHFPPGFRHGSVVRVPSSILTKLESVAGR
ncbi:glycoside hydrolase family 43 protein [Paludisphaera borealis]|uniref:Inverting glycoside hydrolase n=1 Tax=Paludisphaera borealis TaxID=1387353 RepID=A0A1U7CXM9_9BACT|nr:glycoside hydrolase family 43 protein [Paludisphaera borealis]APW63639.1 inverting glycoside hydrolase [Paludisphaera borealis]